MFAGVLPFAAVLLRRLFSPLLLARAYLIEFWLVNNSAGPCEICIWNSPFAITTDALCVLLVFFGFFLALLPQNSLLDTGAFYCSPVR